jgi:hypothetical protein
MAPRVPESLPMTEVFYDELFRFLTQETDDPEVRERQRAIGKAFLRVHADLVEEILQEVLRTDVRAALRFVLAVRALAPSAEAETKIDACADHATLRRWLRQAVVASSVADALR